MKKLRTVLKASPLDMAEWINQPSQSHIRFCLICIIVGCGAYGGSLGYWRAPVMAAYVAIKLPLLIFFTLSLNALLNGMLSMLLGTGLSLKQSLLAQLMSFALFSLILGALAPVTTFFAGHAPPPDTEQAYTAHSAYLLIHTSLIAYAGIMANLQLFRLLIHVCPTRRAAVTTLASWIIGNGIVGTQLSWILRPFFGSPNLEPAFLREDPFNGTFIESIWRAASRFVTHEQAIIILLTTFLITLFTLHRIIRKEHIL